MKIYLVRVGIDTTAGNWNAPVDVDNREFVYVPIPEVGPLRKGMWRPYKAVNEKLKIFASKYPEDLSERFLLPLSIRVNMHLDPDFENLTYGDVGGRRGRDLAKLKRNDAIVFYAGLKPIQKVDGLIYAIIGLYWVDQVVTVRKSLRKNWDKNAHTRRKYHDPDDIVVWARAQKSGRLLKCIPIGEYRDRAYRVTKSLLRTWGDLSCKDGYLQRSAVPPHFIRPKQFLNWFWKQSPQLIEVNNP